MCKGTPIRVAAYFTAETLQDRREWHNVFKVLKEENFHPKYSTQKSYNSEVKGDRVFQARKS